MQLQGDANAGTGTPTFNLKMSNSSTLVWGNLSSDAIAAGADAFAVLVDDVLLSNDYLNYTLSVAALGLQSGMDHFFRLAVSRSPICGHCADDERYMSGGSSQDFTDPVVLSSSGQWTGA